MARRRHKLLPDRRDDIYLRHGQCLARRGRRARRGEKCDQRGVLGSGAVRRAVAVP